MSEFKWKPNVTIYLFAHISNWLFLVSAIAEEDNIRGRLNASCRHTSLLYLLRKIQQDQTAHCVIDRNGLVLYQSQA